MEKIQIPLLPISEKTTVEEVHLLVEQILEKLDEEKKEAPPLYIFIPHAKLKFPQKGLVIPEDPTELVVISIDHHSSAACRRALDVVAETEPNRIQSASKKSIKFKHNTPMKNIFRQMSAIPITVFSFTFGEEGDEENSISMYYMTTAHTVRQFMVEIEKIII